MSETRCIVTGKELDAYAGIGRPRRYSSSEAREISARQKRIVVLFSEIEMSDEAREIHAKWFDSIAAWLRSK